VEPFVNEYGFSYPIVLDPDKNVYNRDGKLFAQADRYENEKAVSGNAGAGRPTLATNRPASEVPVGERTA
jgi:hypothetical protein